MGLPSFYGNPDPEEEAEIFGVPGPEWLSQAVDGIAAEQEAVHLETEGYDDLQEAIEEREWTELGASSRIVTELVQLSDEQLAHVAEFIQELLGDKDEEPEDP